MNSTKRYWFAALLTIISMSWFLSPSLASAQYAACSWAWAAHGGGGWHMSVSPVFEQSKLNCTAFGRWVVKNHQNIKDEFNPDSPKFSPPGSLCGMIGNARTNGEMQAARESFIEKRKGYGEQVEELEWTP